MMLPILTSMIVSIAILTESKRLTTIHASQNAMTIHMGTIVRIIFVIGNVLGVMVLMKMTALSVNYGEKPNLFHMVDNHLR